MNASSRNIVTEPNYMWRKEKFESLSKTKIKITNWTGDKDLKLFKFG